MREIASLRSTVLIRGESGTGKELIARAIHNSGRPRRQAVRGGLLRGAGRDAARKRAVRAREGRVHRRGRRRRRASSRLADGGTIFLDEIGDISPKLQVDLLRVLQERCFYRVGGSEEVRVDVRVIAATHRDLQQAVEEGKFRDDLVSTG